VKCINSWSLLANVIHAGEIDKLIILTTCLCLLAVFSLSLFVGVINQSPLYILPWIWIKYAMIILQVLRFLSVIVEIAATNKNHAGASPVFELLFLGKQQQLAITSCHHSISLF